VSEAREPPGDGTPGPAPTNEARERLCDAMLELATANSYEATSVEALIERAGSGREEFERLFSSKEDCALATFERFLTEFREEVEEAYESESQWPDSLRAAAYAAARYQDRHPLEFRFGAMELLWAGELAQARREEAFLSFTGMIDAGRKRARSPELLPAHTAEQVIGSLAEMMTRRAKERGARPYDFVPELMYLAVLPYLGEGAARRELGIPAPREVDERRR
jgi:AcrR family transcriptional regulator